METNFKVDHSKIMVSRGTLNRAAKVVMRGALAGKGIKPVLTFGIIGQSQPVHVELSVLDPDILIRPMDFAKDVFPALSAGQDAIIVERQLSRVLELNLETIEFGFVWYGSEETCYLFGSVSATFAGKKISSAEIPRDTAISKMLPLYFCQAPEQLRVAESNQSVCLG